MPMKILHISIISKQQSVIKKPNFSSYQCPSCANVVAVAMTPDASLALPNAPDSYQVVFFFFVPVPHERLIGILQGSMPWKGVCLFFSSICCETHHYIHLCDLQIMILLLFVRDQGISWMWELSLENALGSLYGSACLGRCVDASGA